jgi:hypothetical protein
MALIVPPRRGQPEPWARTWVEESVKAEHAKDPWAVPAFAKFGLALAVGVLALLPFVEIILRGVH